jgi:hypothetical protein
MISGPLGGVNVGYRSWFGALAVAAALLCSAADAQVVATDFTSCDGYDRPRGSRDGISDVGGFWTGPGDRVRHVPSDFTSGIEACTRALQSLESRFPSAWMRRVSVLQARALHRLIANDVPGSLADLDLADQAAVEPTDPFYLRSLNINTNLIRALAFVQSGDHAGGEALAMSTWSRRPYSREVTGAALMIVGGEGSETDLDRLMVVAGQLDPSYSGLIFGHRFETGRFEAALADYDEIVAPMRNGDRGFSISQSEMIAHRELQRVRMELFMLSVIGQKAYALAALGRTSEARAAIALMNDRIARATEPGMSALPGTIEYVMLMARQRSNREIAAQAPAIRDAWANLAEARIDASEGRLNEARTTLAGAATVPSYAVIDLMLATGADDAAVERARQRLSPARLGLPERDPQTLFSLLLDAETRERTASRLTVWDSILLTRPYVERGHCEEGAQGRGLMEVCYSGYDATLAVTEERALLRAAAQSMSRGGRFRIEQRDDIQHSTVSTMYGQPIGGERQSGFESNLIVRFFSDEETCARCLSAADVQSSLSSIYDQALARQ